MNEGLIEVIKRIMAQRKIRDEFIGTLHPSLAGFIFDNPYSLTMDVENDILSEALFGKFYDDVSWFLYEWRPGFTISVNVGSDDEITYTINTEEDYYDYLRKEYKENV